ncbi:hypothetical protein [Aporhodopirellula aestuarii]|uniref:Uncharacterized protein n=1 Tax=Aporhodopirellula aestuarii TaxID=2950107 RepID=A0ABT0U465_9BACT|nr:hypothetical protein [Aporhodopirellula aestuarii]MCM2371646.1 hypothetical protein [Aporhodopirellula aestuarii]
MTRSSLSWLPRCRQLGPTRHTAPPFKGTDILLYHRKASRYVRLGATLKRTFYSIPRKRIATEVWLSATKTLRILQGGLGFLTGTRLNLTKTLKHHIPEARTVSPHRSAFDAHSEPSPTASKPGPEQCAIAPVVGEAFGIRPPGNRIKTRRFCKLPIPG